MRRRERRMAINLGSQQLALLYCMIQYSVPFELTMPYSYKCRQLNILGKFLLSN